MRHKNFDLIIVIASTLLAVLLALTGAINRIPCSPIGVLLFIGLPGYVLSEALFTPAAFGIPERVVLSLGMSVSISVLGGLMLNLTPWGLQPVSWVILLGSVTLVVTGIAFRSRALAGSRYLRPWSDNIARRISTGRERFDLQSTVLFGLAMLVVTGAVLVAYNGAVKQSYQGFTQLWMLSGDQSGPDTLRLGVSNHEPTETMYRLELRLDDEAIRQWPNIDLRSGTQWETTLTLSAGEYGTGQLEAVLFRSDSPDVVYRRVHLTP